MEKFNKFLKFILSLLPISLTGIIYGQDDPGYIFFTNFNFIDSQKRNFSSHGHRHPDSVNKSEPKESTSPPVVVRPRDYNPGDTDKNKDDPSSSIPKKGDPDYHPTPPKPIILPDPPSKPKVNHPEVENFYLFVENNLYSGETMIVTKNLTIDPSMDIGMGSLKEGYTMINQGKLTLNHGQTTNTMVGMAALNGGGIINGDKGVITITGSGTTPAVGMMGVPDDTVPLSPITNNGIINVAGNAFGMFAQGEIVNNGVISAIDGATAIFATEFATVTHAGSIDVNNASGITLKGAGHVYNNGNIDVENGYSALAVQGKGEILNTGKVTISNSLFGMYSEEGTVINQGTLSSSGYVQGGPGIAMAVFGEGHGINAGTIEIEDYQIGMFGAGNANLINEKQGVINVKNGRGMVIYEIGTADNKGIINATESGPAMAATGTGTIINNGTINAYAALAGMVGEESANLLNNGLVSYSDGTNYGVILYNSSATTSFINSETGIIRGQVASSIDQTIVPGISGTCAPALLVHGSGSGINEGKIHVDTSSGAVFVIGDGSFKNSQGGIITAINTRFGIYVSNGGAILNSGNIDIISGNDESSQPNGAMYLDGDGSLINSGYIKVDGTYFSGLGSSGNNTIINATDGKIHLVNSDSKSSAFSLHGGTGINFGLINLESSGLAVTGGNLYNWGHIKFSNELKTGNNGKIIMEQGGTTESMATKLYVGQSYFPELYSEGDINFSPANLTFSAQEIPAISYVYETKGPAESALIRRKKFTEITESGIGNYLENIYYTDNSLKEEFFNVLRSAETKEQYDAYVDIFFGRDFYPMLSFQTRNVIRYTADTLLENLDEKLLGNRTENWIGGYLYEEYKQKGFDRVEGYEEDINGLYLGKQYRYNSSLDLGGIFTYTRADSNFHKNGGKRWDNYFQGSLFGYFEKNDLKGMGILYGGYSQGHLTRNRNLSYLYYSKDNPHYEYLSESSTADIRNSYIGISGKFLKRYPFKKSYFLEPEIRFHAMGIFQEKIDENGGKYAAKVQDLNKFFSKTSLFLNIGKDFQMGSKNILTLTLKAGISQNLNSERQDLKISLKNFSSEHTKVNMSKENVFAQELGIRGEFKNRNRGEFSIYADYRYTFEVDNSWRLSSGIQYRF